MSYVEVEMYAPLRVFPWLLWTKLSLNSSPSHPEVVYFADGPSPCIKGKNMWDKCHNWSSACDFNRFTCWSWLFWRKMKPSYLISISTHSFSTLDRFELPKPCASRTLYSMCGFFRRLSRVEWSFTGWPDRRVTSTAKSPPWRNKQTKHEMEKQ